MKKDLALIVLAAAMLCATTMAFAGDGPQATVYSKFRYSLAIVDGDTLTDGVTGRDNTSVFGIKGSFPNAEKNIEAFFHLQTFAFADGNTDKFAFKQRFFFGGVKGDFGKVSFGLIPNSYKLAGFNRDPFANFSHINAKGGFAGGGVTYGLSKSADSFTSNGFEYETPDMEGLKLVGGLFVDDSDLDEHGYLGRATYNRDEFTVGVSMAANGETVTTIAGIAPDGTGIRGFATYAPENFRVDGVYEIVDSPDGEDMTFIFVAATVPVKSINTDFMATVGIVDSGPYEGFGVSGGAYYTVAPGARILALVSMADLESGENPVVFMLGTNFSFSSIID